MSSPAPKQKYHTHAYEEQKERAYLKQKGVFQNPKKIAVSKRKGGQAKRFFRNVGLGFETPGAAREGTYVDNKCPFTGQVHIHGRVLKGTVISNKMKRTIVIRRHYLHYVRKYNRFEKRHRNVPAHISPCFVCKEGDVVTIGECRPLSKTVAFNVLKVEPKQIFGSAKKQFRLF